MPIVSSIARRLTVTLLLTGLAGLGIAAQAAETTSKPGVVIQVS